MSSPSYWSICVGGVAGAIRRLCQLWLFVSVIRADTELFYCSSLHLLPVDEWQRTAQILKKTLVSVLSHQPSESTLDLRDFFISYVYTWIFFQFFLFCNAKLWDIPKMSTGLLKNFFFLMKSNNVKAFNGKGNISWWGTGGVVPLLL